MQDEVITEYIDEKGIIRQGDLMVSEINRIYEHLQKLDKVRISFGKVETSKELKQLNSELIASQKQLEGSINRLSAAYEQSTKTQTKHNETKKQGKRTTDESLSATEKEAKAQLENNRAKEQAAKYQNALQKELDKTNKERVKEEERLGKISNAYEQLKTKYTIAANSAKQLAAAKGLDNEETKEAIVVADGYYNQLLKIEKAVGQSQRQVGNYTQATFALSQVIREAPAFMYSFQTGLLGISNNIPSLIEEYDKLKSATGSSASAFGILAKSLFSPINLISIGIALFPLLTQKIGEWTGSSFNAAEAQKEIADAATKLNDIIKKQTELYSQNSKEQIKYLQKQLDIAEKSGVSAERLFSLRKSVANAESNLTDSQIIEQAQQISADRVMVDSKEKALGVLKNAQLSYNVTLQGLYAQQAYLIQQHLSAVSKGDKDEVESIKEKQDVLQRQIGLNEGSLSTINDLVNASFDNQKQKDALATEQAKFNADERRKLVLESTRIEADLTISKNDKVLNDERSTLDERLAALKSNLAARKKVIKAEKADVLNDPGSSSVDRTLATKEAAKAEKIATLDTQTTILQVREDFRLRDLQAIKEAYVTQKNLDADLQKELSASQLLALEQRLQAQLKYSSSQRDILKSEYELKLKQAGISDSDIAALEKDRNFKVTSKKITDEELLALQVAYETDIVKLSIASGETVNEILKSNIQKKQAALEGSLGEIERIYGVENVVANIATAKELVALNESFAKKKISYRQYNEDRAKLEQKYSQQTLANIIRSLEDQLRYFTDAEQQEIDAKAAAERIKQQLAAATTDAERKELLGKLELANADVKVAKDTVTKKIELQNKLATASMNLSNSVTKNDEANEQKKRDAVAQTLNSLAQISDQITALVGAYSNNRLQKIEGEQEALEKRFEREKEIIDQTSSNELEKKERLAKAEAHHAAQKDALDRREKAERIKKAQFEKQQAIFSIILNTAAAVVKALPNVPLAIATGIIGALQLTTAVAQDIPRYFKGKTENDRYEGLAHVGEKGSELIIHEDGSMEVTPPRETIKYIHSKDIILTAAQTQSALSGLNTQEMRKAQYNSEGYKNTTNDKDYSSEINRVGKEVVKAIKNIPQTKVLVKDVLRSWVSSGESSTELLNRYRG